MPSCTQLYSHPPGLPLHMMTWPHPTPVGSFWLVRCLPAVAPYWHWMPPYLQQDMSYLCNAVCIISIQHGEHNWWLTRNMFGIEHPSLVLTLSTKGKEAFVSHLLALVPALVSCLCREKILPVQRLLAALKSDSLRSPALFLIWNRSESLDKPYCGLMEDNHIWLKLGIAPTTTDANTQCHHKML